MPSIPGDSEESGSIDQTPSRLRGLKDLFERSSKLLKEIDDKKSTHSRQSEELNDINALGEKMELCMITEEEYAEKTVLSMQSNISEDNQAVIATDEEKIVM